MEEPRDPSNSRTAGITRPAIGILLVGIWLLCAVRAITFVRETHLAYAEVSSINTWNDFVTGSKTLVSGWT